MSGTRNITKKRKNVHNQYDSKFVKYCLSLYSKISKSQGKILIDFHHLTYTVRKTLMLVEVIPLHTSYRDAGFTYRVPDELVERVRIGSLVEVPISRRTDDGIVASMQKERDFP